MTDRERIVAIVNSTRQDIIKRLGSTEPAICMLDHILLQIMSLPYEPPAMVRWAVCYLGDYAGIWPTKPEADSAAEDCIDVVTEVKQVEIREVQNG